MKRIFATSAPAPPPAVGVNESFDSGRGCPLRPLAGFLGEYGPLCLEEDGRARDLRSGLTLTTSLSMAEH
ncbi:hypothetical protein PBY51_022918 [Eleginops maclovinus]|uniref:Uncharacterized protein n=1 Tax=Eleginops maclovinus TaxID=56733 RepID=A0AAN7XI54_ELEMC|nr:hypothetical protein PBY51_022918 [Eleginops maclovinus]